jgi:hypothetical protein
MKMVDWLFYSALAAMAGVLVVLGFGITSLVRGGDFREKWSNKLMRLRILLQAVAVVCLAAFAFLASRGG